MANRPGCERLDRLDHDIKKLNLSLSAGLETLNPAAIESGLSIPPHIDIMPFCFLSTAPTVAEFRRNFRVNDDIEVRTPDV